MLKFFASPKPKRRASFEDDKVLDTVKALQSLQQTLHKLSPAEQSRVKHELSFASAEWLEGLALSIKAQAETTVVSLDGSSHSERARTGRFSESATDARIRLTPDSGKVVLVLVGLPARGKSLLCHKLEHFLSWRGYVTKAFKVGSYRRGEHKDGETSSKDGEEAVDIADPQYPSATDEPRNLSPSQDRAQFSSASFFDSTKAFAALSRETVSLAAFDELLAWLTGPDNGQVAIFDASNVTVQRRAKLQEKVNALKEKASVGLVFIETICTDEEVIHDLKLWKVRNSPDFAGMTEEAALADLHDRIGHYEKVYQVCGSSPALPRSPLLLSNSACIPNPPKMSPLSCSTATLAVAPSRHPCPPALADCVCSLLARCSPWHREGGATCARPPPRGRL